MAGGDASGCLLLRKRSNKDGLLSVDEFKRVVVN